MFSTNPSVTANQIVHGYVIDENGNPLKGAKVDIYQSPHNRTSTFTDEFGYFELSYSHDSFKIEILRDNQNTVGQDYFRYTKSIIKYNETIIEIKLTPSAMIYLDTNLRLINTENNYEIYKVNVINPQNEDIFNIKNYGELQYQSHQEINQLQIPVYTRINFELEYYDTYIKNINKEHLSITITDALNGSLKQSS